MRTTSLDLTVGSRGRALAGPHWGDVKQQFASWWHNMRSRAELESLDDRSLQDIGLTRCTADFEAAKPFWIA